MKPYFLALLIPLQMCGMLQPVPARDVGQWGLQSPDVSAWFNSLKQPDNKDASCCGEADAYYADKVDTDALGQLVAIITDTREDSPLSRRHVPVGTRVVIPASKIRKHYSPNPTEHAIVFLGNLNTVYCYEPLPLL
jgi:hypothetical protein